MPRLSEQLQGQIGHMKDRINRSRERHQEDSDRPISGQGNPQPNSNGSWHSPLPRGIHESGRLVRNFLRTGRPQYSTSPSQQNFGGIAHQGNVDLTIQFLNATGIPRTDAVGGSDPYFKAKLDDRINYVSTIQPSTLTPNWNEVWHIKNVPASAELKVKVWDKDEGTFRDDYIGKFSTAINSSGTRELPITSMMGKSHGTFVLNIIANPCLNSTLPLYTFAGPCRYSRHRSPTLGAFTIKSTEERLYSSWKIHVMGVSLFFKDTYQEWNRDYPAARSIFQGPLSPTVRVPIQAGHKLLYARSTANVFGILHRAADFINLFKDESRDYKIKPAIYTYIVDEDTMRFSETGAAFFVDFASKHALHSNCATRVRYSGEFHWRPFGGWGNWRETATDEETEWEIVLDNNSGTYSPDAGMLPSLRSMIEYNFPGLKVVTYDHSDPALKESTNSCRDFAKNHRGVTEEEFVPHKHEGEQSLHSMASLRRK